MKKIYLFLTLTALAITGCSEDSDKDTKHYLAGTWKETEPTANEHIITFEPISDIPSSEGTFLGKATISRSDGTSQIYDYTASLERLTFTIPDKEAGTTTHNLEKVSSRTIKLSGMYIQDASSNSTPIITTFKKQ